jgi:two-component system cell cycle response regulator
VTEPTVLVVDDSPLVQRVLTAQLGDEGCRVVTASGGIATLARVRAEQPDLILLDLVLRDMSGFEVLRILKEDARTNEVPVILISSRGDVPNKVHGFELGAVDYVVKPFDHAELRARVRAALRTKRYLDLLSERSRIDGLTGLWNRAYFDRRLADEVAGARRYRRRFGLVLADVDHFKAINDAHGHPFGDRVLMAVGEALQQALRVGDAACRFGGDEFAIVLPESGRPEALLVAQRLRERVAALALSAGDHQVSCTISLGAACSDEIVPAALTVEALVDAADRALYAAKRAGRDRVCMPERAAG